MLRARADHDVAAGDAYLQRLDVPANRAGVVMVLAVHVGGHHAAESDEARARRDGTEKPARQEHANHSSSVSPASAVSSPVHWSNARSRLARPLPATRVSPRAGSAASPYARPSPRVNGTPRDAWSSRSDDHSVPGTRGKRPQPLRTPVTDEIGFTGAAALLMQSCHPNGLPARVAPQQRIDAERRHDHEARHYRHRITAQRTQRGDDEVHRHDGHEQQP